MAPIRAATLALAAVCLALVACGGDETEAPPAPATAFAGALAGLGGGGDGSIGVGWVDPALARQRGLGTALMADALGPNAGTFVEEAKALRRRFGLDPLAAESLVAVGGSYAFGIRMDGVDPQRLRRALSRGDARVSDSGDLELVNAGAYAQVPAPLLELGIRGLGARDAFGPDVAVLAMSARARATLLGRGESLAGEPAHRAAAECLGDVAAVRTIPDRHLISTELGIDLLAIGMASPRREVLCAVGGTSERADEIEGDLGGALAPGATEPRSGEPMEELVESADVTASEPGGVPYVRAELTTPAGTTPGFWFGTVARGSLVELVYGA
jgi:hypothetical protein